MAQQSEGNESKDTVCDDRSLLWSVSDKVQIGKDGHITCEEKSPWQQIGVDHIINTSKDRKTSWRVKIGAPHKNVNINYIMIGIATKGIINQINYYAGQFMFGFQFYNHTGYWNAGTHQGLAANQATLLWAPGDEIRIEFINYQLSLFINKEPIYSLKLKEYVELKKQQFVPSISIHLGTSCQFLGVTQH